MTVRESTVRGSITSQHIVQFFDSDESRAECAASFLTEGFQQGEPVVIVARPSNWLALSRQLKALGVPVDAAMADKRIVVKDAVDTLRRISPSGTIDAEAFESVLAKGVLELAAGGTRIRAYGEMVDILAQRGDVNEAIKLEHLWNRLGERAAIYLMCGYSAAHFVATATHRALREICSAHSGVHRHPQDPLATWLLNSAHNAPGASSITH